MFSRQIVRAVQRISKWNKPQNYARRFNSKSDIDETVAISKFYKKTGKQYERSNMYYRKVIDNDNKINENESNKLISSICPHSDVPVTFVEGIPYTGIGNEGSSAYNIVKLSNGSSILVSNASIMGNNESVYFKYRATYSGPEKNNHNKFHYDSEAVSVFIFDKNVYDGTNIIVTVDTIDIFGDDNITSLVRKYGWDPINSVETIPLDKIELNSIFYPALMLYNILSKNAKNYESEIKTIYRPKPKLTILKLLNENNRLKHYLHENLYDIEHERMVALMDYIYELNNLPMYIGSIGTQPCYIVHAHIMMNGLNYSTILDANVCFEYRVYTPSTNNDKHVDGYYKLIITKDSYKLFCWDLRGAYTTPYVAKSSKFEEIKLDDTCKEHEPCRLLLKLAKSEPINNMVTVLHKKIPSILISTRPHQFYGLA
jgi:hypothetical protein